MCCSENTTPLRIVEPDCGLKPVVYTNTSSFPSYQPPAWLPTHINAGSESCRRIAAADLASVAQLIYDADDNRVDGAAYQLNFQQRYHTGVDNPLPWVYLILFS